MKLRARFTVLFAVLSAAAVVFLVIVSDATVRRTVQDRVAERFRRDLAHLADDLARGVPGSETRDDFLRRAAADLDCRVTYIAPDGRVLDDTDLLPADVPAMENHANRPEVREATASGSGILDPRVADRAEADAVRRPPTSRRQRPATRRLRGAPARRGPAVALGDARRDARRLPRPVSHRCERLPAFLRADRRADARRFRRGRRRLRARFADGRRRRGPAPRRRDAAHEERLEPGGPARGIRAAPDGDGLRTPARRSGRRGREAPGPRGQWPLRRDDGDSGARGPGRLRGSARAAALRLFRGHRRHRRDDRTDRPAPRRSGLADRRRGAARRVSGRGGRRPARRHATRADRGDAPHLRGGRLARAAHPDRVDRRRGGDARRSSARQGGIARSCWD